ncbi:MAG: ABC transporter permease [Actinobacteria bacterium]|nr:MAG: ABC transporter permease [Actinomycetota bacterium]
MTISARPSLTTRVSAYLHGHPGMKLALLLSIPVAWLVGLYGGSLFSLLLNSFYRLDPFSGTVEEVFTLDTWKSLFTESNFFITLRTVSMAAAVTVGAIVVAFPLAYYMGRYASSRVKMVLYLAVLLPLWSSYLVRVYSWKLILAKEGIIFWFFDRVGLGGLIDLILRLSVVGGPSLYASMIGQWMVFLYIWLPFMILPVQASVERIPGSYYDASADLGAGPGTTFRRVVWPLVLPGVIAGSIFTFSLTLGDYIIPGIIGDSSPFIGLAIYSYQGTSGNLPLAAAFSFVPLVIMIGYLVLVRRSGALENL